MLTACVATVTLASRFYLFPSNQFTRWHGYKSSTYRLRPETFFSILEYLCQDISYILSSLIQTLVFKHAKYFFHHSFCLFSFIQHLVTGGGAQKTIHLLWFWRCWVPRIYTYSSPLWRNTPSFSHAQNRLMHAKKTQLGSGVCPKRMWRSE